MSIAIGFSTTVRYTSMPAGLFGADADDALIKKAMKAAVIVNGKTEDTYLALAAIGCADENNLQNSTHSWRIVIAAATAAVFSAGGDVMKTIMRSPVYECYREMMNSAEDIEKMALLAKMYLKALAQRFRQELENEGLERLNSNMIDLGKSVYKNLLATR